jgi:peptide deformylase
MALRKIIYPDNPVLRKKARRVREFNRKLPDGEEWVEEYGDDAGKLYQVVNPEIIRKSREMVDGVEACLSIPGYFGTVERHEEVVIRGQDRNGEPIRIKARDWLARVFQHEIDHLDGVLYTDIASEIWKAGEEPSGARENGNTPSASAAEASAADC